MARRKKYTGNDKSPYTRQDSLDVQKYRQMSEYLGEDAADSFQKKYNVANPKLMKMMETIVADKKKSMEMGDFWGTKKTVLKKKRGGIVKGNRNMFTEQYD
jgi:hypothetical protein